MSDITETSNAWLSDEDLETVRGRVPMVYVDAVPVRVDDVGEVVEVGLLLRAMADGTVSRALVTRNELSGLTPQWTIWLGGAPGTALLRPDLVFQYLSCLL